MAASSAPCAWFVFELPARLDGAEPRARMIHRHPSAPPRRRVRHLPPMGTAPGLDGPSPLESNAQPSGPRAPQRRARLRNPERAPSPEKFDQGQDPVADQRCAGPQARSRHIVLPKGRGTRTSNDRETELSQATGFRHSGCDGRWVRPLEPQWVKSALLVLPRFDRKPLHTGSRRASDGVDELDRPCALGRRRLMDST